MLRYKRLILNTPASKIRSAAMGLVELTGMTNGPQTIPAGITGEPCYFYRALAWELRQSGNNRQWKQVANESVCLPFFLEDATGNVPVNPQGADIDLHCNFKDELGSSFFGSGTGMMSPSVALFLARNNVNMSRKIRLEEYCIKPGFPLWVMGTLGENSQRLYWTPAKQVPRSTLISGKSATPHARMNIGGTWALSLMQGFGAAGSSGTAAPAASPTVTNASRVNTPRPAPAAVWSSVSADEIAMGRPGSASADSSKTARAAAVLTATADNEVSESEHASAPVSNAPSNDDCPPALLSKGPGSEPFIISWRSQKEVVSSLAWKSALCIWGGPALTLVSFYMLAQIFGWL